MSHEADVLAVTTIQLSPGKSTTLPTFNGTSMTLILNNLSTSNNCGFAVSSNALNESGTLPPTGQQTYGPINFKGGPVTVTNTTPPGTPAILQVILS
jgi:hypothetical protein